MACQSVYPRIQLKLSDIAAVILIDVKIIDHLRNQMYAYPRDAFIPARLAFVLLLDFDPTRYIELLV